MGLLQLLPTPPYPWHTVGVDFVTGLPPSNKMKVVGTVVDLLTNTVHFIQLSRLPGARVFAQAFIQHVV